MVTSADSPEDATACGDKHRALLAVSEAIAAHHDLRVLFHELAVRLHHVVCFETLKVDVRLVAATNRDLWQMVAEGRFRNGLYYRLNVFPLSLPPLRERGDDIPRLVRHFTQRYARRMGRRIENIPAPVMEKMVHYSWPGNVRELQNVIERAVILSPGPTLEVPLADLEIGSQKPEVGGQRSDVRGRIPKLTPRTLISDLRPLTLRWRRPNASTSSPCFATPTGCWAAPRATASHLGMKRSTLRWKMKKLDISRPQQRPPVRARHVFVNGVQVLTDGDDTVAKPGRFVRGPGWKG